MSLFIFNAATEKNFEKKIGKEVMDIPFGHNIHVCEEKKKDKIGILMFYWKAFIAQHTCI